MSHVALYGKIKLIREYCDHCQVNTLVVDGHRQCCGKQFYKLIPVWDHAEPFMFSQNNEANNFVASCSYCNGWKSSKIFQSLEEVKDYVRARWEKKAQRTI